VWSIDTVTVTDLHMEDRSGYNGCGPVLTPAPDANTLVNCDRCVSLCLCLCLCRCRCRCL
jgi:hypothetical protein